MANRDRTRLDEGGHLIAVIILHCHPNPVNMDILRAIFGKRTRWIMETVETVYPIWYDEDVAGIIDGDYVDEYEAGEPFCWRNMR